MNQPADDPFENLLFETSPFGNIDAIVEHDGRSVYFYLNHREGKTNLFPTKACWVRNLTPGPLVINKQEMEQGIPPQLPRTHSKTTTGSPCPRSDELHVVWLEEGNGAALCETTPVENEENVFQLTPLTIIPPWSGMDGFHGYSAECASESPICWPLPAGATDPLMKRIDAAREFWQSFGKQESDPFQRLQQELLELLQQRFGEPEKYFAIDGSNFPPRGMVQFRNDQAITLVTVAMSLCPQPNVELSVDQPRWHRRVELGIQLPPTTSTEQLQNIRERLSGIAAYPWNNFTWLGQGHTIDLIANLQIEDQPCDFGVFAADSFLAESREFSKLELPEFRGDPVNLLWLIPISASEQQQLKNQQLVIDQLPAQRLIIR